MNKLKHTHSIFDLKNTLAALGASIGVAISPVATAADGSVSGANGELVPAVVPHRIEGTDQHKNASAPGSASQLKYEAGKSAPQGASQWKENSFAPAGANQQKGEVGKTTPQGTQQLKIEGKSAPQGAQQNKFDSVDGKSTSQGGQ